MGEQLLVAALILSGHMLVLTVAAAAGAGLLLAWDRTTGWWRNRLAKSQNQMKAQQETLEELSSLLREANRELERLRRENVRYRHSFTTVNRERNYLRERVKRYRLEAIIPLP